MSQGLSADRGESMAGNERLGGRAARGASSPSPMTEGRSSADTREANGQRGAFAGGAGNGNRSTMLFDDLFDGRETQTCPGALRGKERLEYFVENFCRDGGAVVLDQDLHLNAAAGAMLGDLNVQ